MTTEIVTCQRDDCEREATDYWWVKVDDRQVETLVLLLPQRRGASSRPVRVRSRQPCAWVG